MSISSHVTQYRSSDAITDPNSTPSGARHHHSDKHCWISSAYTHWRCWCSLPLRPPHLHIHQRSKIRANSPSLAKSQSVSTTNSRYDHSNQIRSALITKIQFVHECVIQ